MITESIVPRSLFIALCVAEVLIFSVIGANAAEPPGNSQAYDEYVRNELEKLRPLMLETERRVRQEVISKRLALFEESGDANHLTFLAQERLPADEVAPVFRELLDHPSPQARGAALYGLELCGSAALPALNEIIRRYEDEEDEVSWRAVAAITALGPEAAAAVRPLIQRLRRMTDTRRQRQAAVVALGKIGPAAVEAIPLLEKELANPDSSTAHQAILAIGAIRNEPPIAAESLTARGLDVFLGRDGFRAFASVREGVLSREQGISHLDTLLRRELAPPVAVMALEAMGDLTPSNPDTIGLLLEWTGSPDELVANTANVALAKSAMTDLGTMGVLALELNATQPRKATAAARALARFGPRASPFVPDVIGALQACTGQTDYEQVGAYLDILRAIGSDAAITTPLLTSLLPENSPIYEGRSPHFAKSIRKYLLVTLADIGITPLAIPAIVDMLANSGQGVMIAAGARAAGALRSRQETVIPYLRKVLETEGLAIGISLDGIAERVLQPSPDLTSAYLEAIRALARLGPAAKVAVPLLRLRAQDPTNPSPFYPRYQEEAARAAAALSGE